MTSRDERLAAKYRAKGMKSATETSREREAGRGQTSGGGILGALKNFDKDADKVKPVPLSDESKERARAFKRSLPPLG